MTPSSVRSGNRLARLGPVWALLAGKAVSPIAAEAEDAPNLLTNPFCMALATYVVEWTSKAR